MEIEENAKIKILKKGDLKLINIENVDIENQGEINMSEINFKNGGYYNKEGGVTNIEGKLNTDTLIINEGDFNIKKTGKVNLFRVKKFKKEYPIAFWSAVLSATASLFQIVSWWY